MHKYTHILVHKYALICNISFHKCSQIYTYPITEVCENIHISDCTRYARWAPSMRKCSVDCFLLPLLLPFGSTPLSKRNLWLRKLFYPARDASNCLFSRSVLPVGSGAALSYLTTKNCETQLIQLIFLSQGQWQSCSII